MIYQYISNITTTIGLRYWVISISISIYIEQSFHSYTLNFITTSSSWQQNGLIFENAHQLVFSVPGRGEEAKVDDEGGDQISQDWVGYQVAKYLRCEQCENSRTETWK